MTTPKLLFQKNKDLRDQLAAVTQSDWFAQCLVFARAEMLESGITADQLEGARRFVRVLVELPEVESTISEYPAPLLKHDFDKPSPKKKE